MISYQPFYNETELRSISLRDRLSYGTSGNEIYIVKEIVPDSSASGCMLRLQHEGRPDNLLMPITLNAMVQDIGQWYRLP